ncbi:hypothetical protein NF27_IC00090 [Candidatus Jidaibacter acanthamoeba]|uniref:Uncharacterized protein n=1 Tax=Candidatus Jidaibacter acanthamoebae TaxID=86105 RepID=A0A0C1MWW6_9RICK|nr:hypothetical protein [Candidatus Jidaibacter acanthamoeba]KIE04391.1 hypothetical protein NF27_IC00090 [Candidatus Jidaibacter acanthamoeba]
MYLEIHYIPNFTSDKRKVRGVFSFITKSKIENLIVSQHLSSLKEILPISSNEQTLKLKNKLFKQAILQVDKALKTHKVNYDHKTILDIVNNVYENFYCSETIDANYIDKIIDTGIKAGKLSCL